MLPESHRPSRAAPIDGRANRGLCKLSAPRASGAPSSVMLVGGERGRDNRVRVEGVERDAIERALNA